jgi:hypothetical protein
MLFFAYVKGIYYFAIPKLNVLMKRFLLIVFLFALHGAALAQFRSSIRPHDGYYAKDSLLVFGVTIVGGVFVDGQKCVEVVSPEETLIFSPYDIDEYGAGQDVYVSAYIFINDSKKRVFLKRLHKGDLSLYSYRERGYKMYFLEKEKGVFLDLPRRWEHNREISFKDILEDETSDCEHTALNLKNTSYSKESLTEFVKRYNDCSPMPTNAADLGVVSGFSFSNLALSVSPGNTYKNQIAEMNTSDFMIGVFISQPLFYSNFSALLGVNYLQMSSSFYGITENNGSDLLLNLNSLQLPLMLRYHMPVNKFRPFASAGCMFGFDITNKSAFYATNFIQDAIFIYKPERFLMEKTRSFGLIGGLGAEYRLSRKKAVSIEMRYSWQKALRYGSGSAVFFDTTGFQILTGISF